MFPAGSFTVFTRFDVSYVYVVVPVFGSVDVNKLLFASKVFATDVPLRFTAPNAFD